MVDGGSVLRGGEVKGEFFNKAEACEQRVDPRRKMPQPIFSKSYGTKLSTVRHSSTAKAIMAGLFYSVIDQLKWHTSYRE